MASDRTMGIDQERAANGRPRSARESAAPIPAAPAAHAQPHATEDVARAWRNVVRNGLI